MRYLHFLLEVVIFFQLVSIYPDNFEEIIIVSEYEDNTKDSINSDYRFEIKNSLSYDNYLDYNTATLYKLPAPKLFDKISDKSNYKNSKNIYTTIGNEISFINGNFSFFFINHKDTTTDLDVTIKNSRNYLDYEDQLSVKTTDNSLLIFNTNIFLDNKIYIIETGTGLKYTKNPFSSLNAISAGIKKATPSFTATSENTIKNNLFSINTTISDRMDFNTKYVFRNERFFTYTKTEIHYDYKSSFNTDNSIYLTVYAPPISFDCFSLSANNDSFKKTSHFECEISPLSKDLLFENKYNGGFLCNYTINDFDISFILYTSSCENPLAYSTNEKYVLSKPAIAFQINTFFKMKYFSYQNVSGFSYDYQKLPEIKLSNNFLDIHLINLIMNTYNTLSLKDSFKMLNIENTLSFKARIVKYFQIYTDFSDTLTLNVEKNVYYNVFNVKIGSVITF